LHSFLSIPQWCDCCLNTSQDLWTYEFLGFTEETETKIEDAMKLITQLLETEPLPRKEIITRLRNEGISKQTTERALAELKSLGKVISQRVGRQTIYSIPKETGQQNLL
jgi:DNA-binding transcriptional ArsR family regulator